MKSKTANNARDDYGFWSKKEDTGGIKIELQTLNVYKIKKVTAVGNDSRIMTVGQMKEK